MKIVTLTLSAAFDIHCDAKEINVNHENIANITGIDAGGKGVNISKALKSFNTDSIALAVLGKENADEFVKKLEKDGICLEKILIDGRIRENITIHTNDGKETRLSFNSSLVPENTIDRIEEISNGICDKDTIVAIVGRVPAGIDMRKLKDYILALKERNIKVVIDSKSFSLADLKEIKPFMVKPNQEEISEYIGMEITNLKDAEYAAKELYRIGIENVMVTLGERGSILVSNGISYKAQVPKIQAVSTIGAGDSSIAGFLYAYTNGFSMADCLKYSVAFGTAACLTAGTNPPEYETILKILKKI